MRILFLLASAALTCAAIPALAQEASESMVRNAVHTTFENRLSAPAAKPMLHQAQYMGPSYHSQNSAGFMWWSINSPAHAVDLCIANTPVGYRCWYVGFW